MAIATKTVNPLHFEDLEPHRFEDLVRQLIYDYREWKALEATGRQGTDDGFDARGWEIYSDDGVAIEDDEVENSVVEKNEEDRIWLIQCKREKSIAPKKLIDYLNGISNDVVSNLHGLIFVAACDFSKKTRDNFRSWCQSNKINEFHIWGRSELEDLLFQPKYDPLLFAYFGISLQIRKRSAKSKLRSMLATKRQSIRHLGDIESYTNELVLLRDPDALKYPYSDEIKNFDENPTWRVYSFIGHYHAGLKFLVRTHFAYIDDNGINWDSDENLNTSNHYNDPWAKKVDDKLEMKVRDFWNKIADKNRGTFEVIGVIPYEDILGIDEHGDENFPHPHIYVRFDSKHGPFIGGYREVTTYSPVKKSYFVNKEDQIKFFPDIYLDV